MNVFIQQITIVTTVLAISIHCFTTPPCASVFKSWCSWNLIESRCVIFKNLSKQFFAQRSSFSVTSLKRK